MLVLVLSLGLYCVSVLTRMYCVSVSALIRVVLC